MKEELISIEEISFGYRSQKDVLSGLSLSVKEGERVGIVGANGAGKSTLLKILCGLLLPDRGLVRVAGCELNRKNVPVIREKMGYLFQDSDSQLFMSEVGEEIAFGLQERRLPAEDVEKKVYAALSMTGIEDLMGRKIYELSGGEKKLVALAAVLALSPSVLLFDEPTASFDPANRRRLMRMIESLSLTCMIATHDLDMVWELCPRTVVIKGGRITADGRTRDILSDKNMLERNGLELPLMLQGYSRQFFS